MKHICQMIVFLMVLLSQACDARSLAVSPPFIPREGRLLIIGQQRDAIDGYINDVGIVPGGFMVYTSISEMEGLETPADHGAGTVDARYYVEHYPDAVIQLAIYMVGMMDDTLAGRYDENILRLSRWLKAVKRPVYLRIGYEFDLPDNAYDPLKYQQAYRYIVDHLRAQGVDTAAYVWHSASMSKPSGNFMDWYPGDDYVDWFAVSIFNPMQIARARDLAVLAREHHKPMMIAESTPAGEISVRARKEWFRHYFDFIHEVDVKVVCYINSDWNSYPLFQAMRWGDGRIQKDPEIKEMWLQEMKNGYLQSSPALFDMLTGLHEK